MSWDGYNGDTVHDMYVDGFYANCGSDSYFGFDEPAYYVMPYKPKPQKLTPVQKCEREIGNIRGRIGSDKQRIPALRENLAKLEDGTGRYKKILLRLETAEKRLAKNTALLEKKQAELAELKSDYKRRLKIGIVIASICIPIIILSVIASM